MKITKIEPQKRQKNRSSVYIDGEFAFGMDDFDVLKLKLAEGMELSQERLSEIRETSLLTAAKNYGFRLTAARSYTKAGLLRKMQEKGFGEWEIGLTISVLEEYRLLDDAEYARRFIGDAIHVKGHGRFRIANDLREKGISKELAEQVLAEYDFEELEEEMILPLAKKKLGGNFSIQNIMKTKRYLAARGFGFDAVDRAIKTLCGAESEEWSECL